MKRAKNPSKLLLSRSLAVALLALLAVLTGCDSSPSDRKDEKPVTSRRAFKQPPAPQRPFACYITAVAFSPDGRQAVVGGLPPFGLTLWNTATGKMVHECRGPVGQVYTVAYSHDGRRVACGGEDETVRICDAETGALLKTLKGHQGIVYIVAFTPDDRSVVSWSSNQSLKVWDEASGEEQRTLASPPQTRLMALSPDAKLALCRETGNKLLLWNTATSQVVHKLTGQIGQINTAVFSPDGAFALSGGDDGKIKVWNLSTGKEFRTLEGDKDDLDALAVSADAKLAVSGNSSGGLKVWDIATGKLVQTLAGHRGEVKSVAISPDGRRVLAGGGFVQRTEESWLRGPWDKRSLVLWELPSGKLIRTWVRPQPERGAKEDM